MQVLPSDRNCYENVKFVCDDGYNILLLHNSLYTHYLHFYLKDNLKKILMQHSPYYDTYGAYITYIVNIDTYMVDSEFVIWKNSVKFVCENNV